MDYNNTNIVAYHYGHDSNVAWKDGNTYKVIQIEKLRRMRYSNLYSNHTCKFKGKTRNIIDCVNDLITNRDNIDYTIHPGNTWFDWNRTPYGVKEIVSTFERSYSDNNIRGCSHHEAHAYQAFVTSPFDKALVITCDGGGDGEFFTVSLANRDGIKQIDSVQYNMGGLYTSGCSFCEEIDGGTLSWSGKGMGLVARGKNILPHYQDIMKILFQKSIYVRYKMDHGKGPSGFFLSAEAVVGRTKLDKVKYELGLKHYNDSVSGQMSYDVMYNTQIVFERLFDMFTEKYINKYDLPIVLTGGCALNVLNNERIKIKYGREVFVPSAPDDSGLALGYIFEKTRPKNQIRTHDIGPELYDKRELEGRKTITNEEIVKLLQDGKIIGYAQGPSELGPRALGFRSILCDPTYPGMKDKINKIKRRQWWRPFAPACRKEDAPLYFDSPSFEHMEFMSFAVKVKEEAKQKIPAVVHVDGTARLQTVTSDSNEKFYDLLCDWNRITGKHVLLNTSLNSWGEPIANTIEQCHRILQGTELDCLVIENRLFR
jgi:carbamoyltransferase